MTVQRHLRILNCGTESDAMDSAIRVAFASLDLKHVDQHFGAAESLATYAVTPRSTRLLEVVQFGRQAMDGSEDKLVAKVQALDGCVAVYANAIGASAVSQLLANGVQPIKVEAGSPVARLLADLQDELRSGPNAWLARAIARQTSDDVSRFAAMEAEGWDE